MIQYKVKKFILLLLINLHFIFQNLYKYIFYLRKNFLYKNDKFLCKKKTKKKKYFCIY